MNEMKWEKKSKIMRKIKQMKPIHLEREREMEKQIERERASELILMIPD